MSLLYWIDRSPGGYWLSALFVAACLAFLAFLPLLPVKLPWTRCGRRGRIGEEIAFCFLIFLTLFAFRWVFFFYPRYFNPDEAAFVMGALTLEHDPVFWRSIALGTSGPLNGYILLLPKLLGADINYTSVRIVGLLLAGGSIVFLYLIGKNLLHSKLARLIVLGPVAFFALTVELDFVHFSSEHVPLFLLSAACYFISAILCRDRPAGRDVYLAGLMLGSVPFAKLQGVPPAGLMAIVAYVFLLTRPESWPRRLTLAGTMTLGGATMAIIFTAMTLATGCFGHALHAYLGMNSHYAEHGGVTLAQMIGLLSPFLHTAETFRPYVLTVSVLGLLVSAFGFFRRKHAGSDRWMWALSTLSLLGAWLAVVMPGRLYEHYLLLLVIPTAFWLQTALVLAGIGKFNQPESDAHRASTLLMVVTIVAMLLWPLFGGFHKWQRPLGRLKEFREAPPRPVVAAVRRHADEGELVALWGWMYEICAEGGLVRGTRNFVLEHAWVDTSIPGRPNIIANYTDFVPKYYFDLFLEDMERNKPKLFVDACAPGAFNFRDRSLFGHETFPELAAYVRTHYEPAEEIEQVRIYRRKN